MEKLLHLILICSLFFSCKGQEKNNESQKTYPVTKTESEWKAELSEFEFYVLRQAGTERPYTSELNDNHKKGTYVCAGCQNPLYTSDHKFNSGTGWPSFDQAIAESIDTSIDYKLGYGRKELLCNNCGGHLGHLFSDGPRETTGQRHCINGVSLNFIPE